VSTAPPSLQFDALDHLILGLALGRLRGFLRGVTPDQLSALVALGADPGADLPSPLPLPVGGLGPAVAERLARPRDDLYEAILDRLAPRWPEHCRRMRLEQGRRWYYAVMDGMRQRVLASLRG
jgi:hypothetical protein